MKNILCLLVAILLLSGKSSWAQISDESGKFQYSCAENGTIAQCPQTVEFDGVRVEILRLIKEPNTENDLRVIARITNFDAPDMSVAIYFPTPEIIDQLGNPYFVEAVTGIPFCSTAPIKPRFGGDLLFFDLRTCHHIETASRAIRLARDVPLNASLVFTPKNSYIFSPKLATLATFASLRLHLIRFIGETGKHNISEVFFGRIPLPRQE